jgi:hypothetical protein
MTEAGYGVGLYCSQTIDAARSLNKLFYYRRSCPC